MLIETAADVYGYLKKPLVLREAFEINRMPVLRSVAKVTAEQKTLVGSLSSGVFLLLLLLSTFVFIGGNVNIMTPLPSSVTLTEKKMYKRST